MNKSKDNSNKMNREKAVVIFDRGERKPTKMISSQMSGAGTKYEIFEPDFLKKIFCLEQTQKIQEKSGTSTMLSTL